MTIFDCFFFIPHYVRFGHGELSLGKGRGIFIIAELGLIFTLGQKEKDLEKKKKSPASVICFPAVT